MSGHSKWATIKRQKGANDAKRGKIFTKISYSITTAVREGGGVIDPESNPRLRMAIEEAKSQNMPKENIQRAIARAAGRDGGEMSEAVYEGFGPGGFSVIVEALTDNIQRTVSEVKNIFSKNGGSLGSQGSVLYQFSKKGEIVIDKNGKSLDELFLIAAESGADDIEDDESNAIIYTLPDQVGKVRMKLADEGIGVKSAELSFTPTVLTEITDKNQAKKAMDFVEKLEGLSDVQKVYVNFDIADDLV